MKNPLLSLVIPTKNRYKYLFVLLKTLKSFPIDCFEVVIQDNSDDNKEILDFFQKEGKASNFVYNYVKESLSQSQNSNISILNSKGKYVCFIGDDDGVLPSIIPYTRRLEEKGIESAICTETIYYWPDFKDKSLFKLSSTLSYKKGDGHIEDIEPIESLRNVIKDGFKNLGKMPRVYQGIVRRDVLDKLYKDQGTFFPGGSPDMANATALSTIVKKHCVIHSPIIISGQSKFVGGGERLNGKNLPNIKDVKFLPSNIVETWNTQIPDVWCSDTIWPQTGVYALHQVNYQDVDKLINYDKILAYFLFNHKYMHDSFISYASNRSEVWLWDKYYFFSKLKSYLLNRVTYFFSGKNYVNGKKLIRNLETIEDCIITLSELEQ